MSTVQTGVRYCGRHFYDADDADWNLIGNSGDRTWATTITFDEAYTTSPSVQAFIVFFNITGGATYKLGVGVSLVTEESFQIQIHTWDDTQIAGVGVGWLAIGD